MDLHRGRPKYALTPLGFHGRVLPGTPGAGQRHLLKNSRARVGT